MKDSLVERLVNRQIWHRAIDAVANAVDTESCRSAEEGCRP